MTDLFLVFPDEETAKPLLYTEVVVEQDENGSPVRTEMRQNFFNTDVIGTIYKPTGNMLTRNDGTQIPEVAPTPGWHVNIRLMDNEDGSALQAYAVNPATPNRVWA